MTTRCASKDFEELHDPVCSEVGELKFKNASTLLGRIDRGNARTSTSGPVSDATADDAHAASSKAYKVLGRMDSPASPLLHPQAHGQQQAAATSLQQISRFSS